MADKRRYKSGPFVSSLKETQTTTYNNGTSSLYSILSFMHLWIACKNPERNIYGLSIRSNESLPRNSLELVRYILRPAFFCPVLSFCRSTCNRSDCRPNPPSSWSEKKTRVRNDGGKCNYWYLGIVTGSRGLSHRDIMKEMRRSVGFRLIAFSKHLWRWKRIGRSVRHPATFPVLQFIVDDVSTILSIF